MMLILPESALRHIQEALVGAMHEAVDQNGERVILSTVDDKRLESAALAAMTVVTGEVVWPGSRKLVIKRPKPIPGPIVQEN